MPPPVDAPPASTPAPPATSPPSRPDDGPVDDSLYGAASEIESLDHDEGAGPPGSIQPPAGKATPDANRNTPPTPDEDDKELENLDVIENREATNRPPPKEEDQQVPPRETEPPAPTKARDLKVVYEQVKSEKKQLEGKVAELSARVQKLQTTSPEELKALTTRLEQSEKSRAQLESELRYLNYARHPEYQEKYQKPYIAAWKDATADLAGIKITIPGTQDERPAKQQDLIELVNMEYGDAARRAEELFGPVIATQMMAHRKSIIELARKQEAALEDARQEAETHHKTKELETRAHNEKVSRMWEAENESLGTKFPKWYRPVDGDEEGNKLLEKGFAEVDRFFRDPEMPEEERLKAHVRIRNKAANHDRMALRLKRASARIAKLQAELAAYEGGEPPGGKTRRSSGKASGDVFEEANAEIDALERGS